MVYVLLLFPILCRGFTADTVCVKGVAFKSLTTALEWSKAI